MKDLMAHEYIQHIDPVQQTTTCLKSIIKAPEER